jgi:hypothetical protein
LVWQRHQSGLNDRLDLRRHEQAGRYDEDHLKVFVSEEDAQRFAPPSLRVFRNAYNLLMLLPSNNSIFVPRSGTAHFDFQASEVILDFTSPGWGTFEKH